MGERYMYGVWCVWDNGDEGWAFTESQAIEGDWFCPYAFTETAKELAYYQSKLSAYDDVVSCKVVSVPLPQPTKKPLDA